MNVCIFVVFKAALSIAGQNIARVEEIYLERIGRVREARQLPKEKGMLEPYW